MKLRIKGNSIRLRLQKDELLTLYQSGQVQEQVCFGSDENSTLEYVLVASKSARSLEATLANGCISILIPEIVVHEMQNMDRVGIDNIQQIGKAGALSIIVEKDFKCLTPREEDHDAFPHPQEVSGHTC